jgi:tubby-related protein 1
VKRNPAFTPTIHNLKEYDSIANRESSFQVDQSLGKKARSDDDVKVKKNVNLNAPQQNRDTVSSSVGVGMKYDSERTERNRFGNTRNLIMDVQQDICIGENQMNEVIKSPQFRTRTVLHKKTTSRTLSTTFSHDFTDDEESEVVRDNQQQYSKDCLMDVEENYVNSDIIRSWSENINWDDVNEVKHFLLKPVPKTVGMVQCYIKRSKKNSRLFPEYRIYLEVGNRFLMTSKKRKKNTSNYLISIKRNDHNKGSDNIIGKLRSNFLGTEYQIFDDGKNPKSFDPFFDEMNEDVARDERGVVLYRNNATNTKGPRRMNVCINKVQDDGEPTKVWRPVHQEDDSMLNEFKQNSKEASNHLFYLENRQPKWNEDMSAYVLNFKSRVTMASVKNFQLVNNSDDIELVIMQFGRRGTDEFIMDIRWPMSLFQAFAISLSSCDSKLACD